MVLKFWFSSQIFRIYFYISRKQCSVTLLNAKHLIQLSFYLQSIPRRWMFPFYNAEWSSFKTKLITSVFIGELALNWRKMQEMSFLTMDLKLKKQRQSSIILGLSQFFNFCSTQRWILISFTTGTWPRLPIVNFSGMRPCSLVLFTAASFTPPRVIWV